MSSGWQGLGGRGRRDDPTRAIPQPPPEEDDRPPTAQSPAPTAPPTPKAEPFRLIEEASAAAERIRQDAEREAARILAAARAAQDQESTRLRRQAERDAA